MGMLLQRIWGKHWNRLERACKNTLTVKCHPDAVVLEAGEHSANNSDIPVILKRGD